MYICRTDMGTWVSTTGTQNSNTTLRWEVTAETNHDEVVPEVQAGNSPITISNIQRWSNGYMEYDITVGGPDAVSFRIHGVTVA